MASRLLIHAYIAKKEGYSHFSIDGGNYTPLDRFEFSNIGGSAITDFESIDRFCNNVNYHQKSGLQKSKCMDDRIGYFNVTTARVVSFYKNPVLLFPTMSVDKLLTDIKPVVAQCVEWKGIIKNPSDDNMNNVETMLENIKININ